MMQVMIPTRSRFKIPESPPRATPPDPQLKSVVSRKLPPTTFTVDAELLAESQTAKAARAAYVAAENRARVAEGKLRFQTERTSIPHEPEAFLAHQRLMV